MLPELIAFDGRSQNIRIAHQIDVPVTERILRLIDSKPFRRLKTISQLGLVAEVYPGANHSRFEHSLGVFRNALLFLRQLSQFPAFTKLMDTSDLESFVVASLLHDLGHWPFGHAIEDLGLECVPKHESLVEKRILESDIAEEIESNWSCSTAQIVRLINNAPKTNSEKWLCSILSGPIDVDKMDYLYRDSLHCGVPYGMNFDAQRLVQSVCPNVQQNGIAISPKGKTALEMMVFARYVMFSEVYWHHAVRSATSMLQRLVYELLNQNSQQDSEWIFDSTDSEFLLRIRQHFKGTLHEKLTDCLFGDKRILYKRVFECSGDQHPNFFRIFAHRRYEELFQIGVSLTHQLAAHLGEKIRPDELLIDAPPPGLEVQFRVEVNDRGVAKPLESISPVVRALAREQFDTFVKRVRIFVHPRILYKIQKLDFTKILNSLSP